MKEIFNSVSLPIEKVVLKKFAIFTGKHLFESLSNKVPGLQACNFIKKRLQHRCFPVNIAKRLRTSILKNICERLFLVCYRRNPPFP